MTPSEAQFAGLIEPFLKSTKADVEKLADEQTELEDRFTNYLTRVITALDKQKKEVDKILAADAAELKKVLDENMKKIRGEMAVVGRLIESLGVYDQHFVDLYNSALGLIQSGKVMSRLRSRLYGVLELAPSEGRLGKAVHWSLIGLIAVTLTATVLETVPRLADAYRFRFDGVELVGSDVMIVAYP